MKSITVSTVLCILTCCSCNSGNEKNVISQETWKDEILATERAFAKMAMDDGIPAAFLEYAAEDAVLLRNNNLIIGREALRESYSEQHAGGTKVSLNWSPDFVDVSLSGDLGYTYGKYTFTTTDSVGHTNVMEGVFHTVWKRQPDGKWRFVWD
jgi:ketosteroid isomerase-like protein